VKKDINKERGLGGEINMWMSFPLAKIMERGLRGEVVKCKSQYLNI